MEILGNENHKIIHGDALEALRQHVADGSVDLIFADPPYNIGKNFNGHKDKWTKDDDYLNWCYEWIDLCIKKLKPNGSFYVMTSTQFMPYFDIYLRSKLKFYRGLSGITTVPVYRQKIIMVPCTNLFSIV